MSRRLPTLLLVVLAIFGALAAAPCLASEKVQVVLLRSKGANFDVAAAGFRHNRTPVLDLAVDLSAPVDGLVEKVKSAHPDVLVAIGSDAARFAGVRFPEIPRVVALAPGDDSPHSAPVVVVDSEIPASVQMSWIAEVLPDVQAIGIVYDPKSSQALVDALSAAAAAAKKKKGKLSVVPIPVGAESEVPAAFHQKLGGIQALLFVPDPTVITLGTIRYLLKESLAAGIPAIGFNGYFVQNGAVLAITLDYDGIGRQSADNVGKLLEHPAGIVEPPAKVTVWVNSRVAQKLGIRTGGYPDDVQEIR